MVAYRSLMESVSIEFERYGHLSGRVSLVKDAFELHCD